MHIERHFPHTLKVQINDDVWEQPIISGLYYIHFKRDVDDKFWDGSSWVTTSGNYLQLTHDFNGLWEYQLSSSATADVGQYTAFFANATDPKVYDSLDITIQQTLNYYEVTGD